MAIKSPPDGRQETGQRIEALVHGLDQLVAENLNMASHADRAAAEKKIRDLVRRYPVLAKVLRDPPVR